MSDGAIRHRTPHPENNKAKCGGCRLQAELDALRAALASTATPPEPGLDVERLALAECPEGERDGSGPCSHHFALAVGHVAAYLRLSASPIPEAD